MKFLALSLFGLAMLPAFAQPKGPEFTVHEWGTFTTVSGSDGALLPGLQREEEGLPSFVESHAGMENWGNSPTNSDGTFSIGKGWLRPLKNVTVKMETPVIYFYTPAAFQAHVAVDFHGGSISQWYPSRSGGEIPPDAKRINLDPPATLNRPTGGEIDFARKYEGSIQWDVAVTPPAETDSAKIFRGGETPNWLFPRQTDSALVTSGNGTAEKFLFYRGVGNFELPVRFAMEKDRVLTMQNRTDWPIPRLFVYELGEGMSARFQLLDALPGNATAQVDLEKLTAVGDWRRPVYETLVKALMEAGLYRKEADAMVQTWWQSYFMKPGLRVFWVVPDSVLEEILPLKIDPAPQSAARVLVGRSEILTPPFERDLLKQQADPNFYFWKNTHYSEAYAERIRQLNSHR